MTRSSRKPAQPNARARKRKQAWTLKGKARFLKAFAETGNVLRSCQTAKIGRRTVYDWLASDVRFKMLYDEAHEDALDALEEEARRRAVDGVVEPVYQGGEKVGSIRRYSDALLILLLKGKRPDTYRERHEVTGKNGGPMQSQVEFIHKAKGSLMEKLSKLAARTTSSGGAPSS